MRAWDASERGREKPALTAVPASRCGRWGGGRGRGRGGVECERGGGEERQKGAGRGRSGRGHDAPPPPRPTPTPVFPSTSDTHVPRAQPPRKRARARHRRAHSMHATASIGTKSFSRNGAGRAGARGGDGHARVEAQACVVARCWRMHSSFRPHRPTAAGHLPATPRPVRHHRALVRPPIATLTATGGWVGHGGGGGGAPLQKSTNGLSFSQVPLSLSSRHPPHAPSAAAPAARVVRTSRAKAAIRMVGGWVGCGRREGRGEGVLRGGEDASVGTFLQSRARVVALSLFFRPVSPVTRRTPPPPPPPPPPARSWAAWKKQRQDRE